jgi:hypothetical protein
MLTFSVFWTYNLIREIREWSRILLGTPSENWVLGRPKWGD